MSQSNSNFRFITSNNERKNPPDACRGFCEWTCQDFFVDSKSPETGTETLRNTRALFTDAFRSEQELVETFLAKPPAEKQRPGVKRCGKADILVSGHYYDMMYLFRCLVIIPVGWFRDVCRLQRRFLTYGTSGFANCTRG